MEPTQAPLPTPVRSQRPDEKTRKKLLIWGLISLIGPTALFVLTIFLYALANFVSSSSVTSGSDSLFGPANPAQSIMNIVLFIVGIISFLTWLPGIIVGIILLVKRQG